jgi:hypothetical protein
MAVTAFWYGQAIANAFGSTSSGNAPNIDYLTDTINTALTTSSYAVDQDAHQFWSSAVGNEVTGTGYTANGFTHGSKTLTYTAGTNVIAFDADDALWTTSTITARFAVVYDRTPGTDATRPLLMYVNFGADQSSSGGDFKIVWDPAGLMKVTVS